MKKLKDLPDQIKIGPHTIDVFQTPEISENFGTYHYGKSLIEICTDGVSDSVIGDTLIHEILHAVWKQSQLNAILGLEDESDHTSKEEAAVHVLGAQIYGLMRDNPKLVKFIMKDS